MSSTYASLNIHIVFSVKHRAPAIEKEWIHRLHDFIGGIVRGLHAQPIAIGGIADHVHLLIALKPTHCVADVVRDIKRSSSNWIAQTMQCEGFRWQDGYAVFSVSPSMLASVETYIANQAEHHKIRDFKDELLDFLQRSNVDFDARYFD